MPNHVREMQGLLPKESLASTLVDPPITFWHRPFGPEFYGRAEENYDGLQRIHCTQHECTLLGSSEHQPKFPADV